MKDLGKSIGRIAALAAFAAVVAVSAADAASKRAVRTVVVPSGPPQKNVSVGPKAPTRPAPTEVSVPGSPPLEPNSERPYNPWAQ